MLACLHVGFTKVGYLAVEGQWNRLEVNSTFFILKSMITQQKQNTMQVKTLQMKRALHTALLVLLLNVVGMGKGHAYDFSAVCETGQTLYYNITDAANHYIQITFPGSFWGWGWEGYIVPTGNIALPENVQYNGVPILSLQ